MAERQAAARRRRQRRALIGSAAALVLVVGGVFWAVTALTGDEGERTESTAFGPSAGPSAGSSAPAECEWREGAHAWAGDVGTPPPGEPPAGAQGMTVTANP